jgi:TolA-binding protein
MRYAVLLLLLTAAAVGAPRSILADDGDAAFGAALGLFNAGRYDEAALAFTEVRDTFPPLAPKAQRYVGHCLLWSDRHEQALSAYRALLSSYPGTPDAAEANYWMGMTYLDRANESVADLSAALAAFEAQVDGFPLSRKSGQALLKLGDVRARFEDYDDAEACYKRAATDYPEAACDALFLRAVLLQQTGKPADALQIFRDLAADPGAESRRKEATFRIGECLRAQELYDEALAHYGQIAADNPEWRAEALIRRSEVFGDQADFDAALAELDKVIQDYPNSDLAIDAQIRRIDTSYYRVGDFDRAIQEYQKIVGAHPADAWGATALWNIASALERKWEESEGKDQGALDASEQALREIVERGADPATTVGALFELANGHFKRGDYARAAQEAARIVEAYPKSQWAAFVCNYVGTCYMRADNEAEAVAWFKRTENDYSSSPWAEIAAQKRAITEGED